MHGSMIWQMRESTDTSSWACTTLKIYPKTSHIDAITEKAQQCFYLFGRLKRFGLSTTTLSNLCRFSVESVLTGCITAWLVNVNAQEHSRLQKVIGICGDLRPIIEGIDMRHCLGGTNITTTHYPGQNPHLTTTEKGKQLQEPKYNCLHVQEQLLPGNHQTVEYCTTLTSPSATMIYDALSFGCTMEISFTLLQPGYLVLPIINVLYY